MKTAGSGGGWIGVTPSPRSPDTVATTVGSLTRVPLAPLASQGWPLPVTKNMYSVPFARAPRLQAARLRSVCTLTVSVVILPW